MDVTQTVGSVMTPGPIFIDQDEMSIRARALMTTHGVRHLAVLDQGKIVGIVCHGTSILLKTRLSSGELLVKDKTWTGFADAEEQFADDFVGRKIQPFWIEEEARKLEDTNFIVGGIFKPFALRDGNLITGQQQFSGAAAAELVVEALGR